MNTKNIYTTIGASNHSDLEREENDYYATDPKAIDDLLQVETFAKNIWECASGGGHLVDILRKHNKNVFSSDIVNRGCQDDIIDFLKYNGNYNGDIITNPPYKYATEFVLKALDIINVGSKVAMFLKITFLEGQKRYEKIFRNNPPKTIYVYSKRMNCAKGGKFEEYSSSAIAYAWFIWEKGFEGNPTIQWIKGE